MPRKNPYAGRTGYRHSARTRGGSQRVAYEATARGLDATGGKWAVVCEAHKTVLNVDTLDAAKSACLDESWCYDCQNAPLAALIRAKIAIVDQHFEVSRKLDEAFQARYGTTYSDAEVEDLIEVLNYGNKSQRLTVRDCDERMKEAGYPAIIPEASPDGTVSQQVAQQKDKKPFATPGV